jgi:DNA-binding response OmpR family regulator
MRLTPVSRNHLGTETRQLSADRELDCSRPITDHRRIETTMTARRAARLLVVEDDQRTARLLSHVLQNDGYVVDIAANGHDGCEAIRNGQYDLVLLDLMLPDIDGTDVLRTILDNRPQQQIMVLSAVPEIGTRVACLEAGAIDFLAKPFAIAELRARVRLRSRTPWQAVDVLALGPVRLDLKLHRLDVPGRQAILPHREFLLLRHLMLHHDRVCSRDELRENVWGMPFDPGTNLVDVCVRRLRAKLDHPRRIEAIRHGGYRFNPD